jgi:hypothetical protein
VCEIKKELSRRAANKRQKKNEKERKEIEKKLKDLDISGLKTAFPEVSDEIHSDLLCIFQGIHSLHFHYPLSPLFDHLVPFLPSAIPLETVFRFFFSVFPCLNPVDVDESFEAV